MTSFPRALLEENRTPRETENVQGQISVHAGIFTPSEGYCVYNPTNVFCAVLKMGTNLEYSPVFHHMTCLDQSHTSEII